LKALESPSISTMKLSKTITTILSLLTVSHGQVDTNCLKVSTVLNFLQCIGPISLRQCAYMIRVWLFISFSTSHDNFLTALKTSICNRYPTHAVAEL
jgi:hypothetical protein